MRRGLELAATMFARRDLRHPQRAGALYFQALYDAQVLLLLGRAYELTRGSSCYSAEDHRIVSQIFESAMPYQIEYIEAQPGHNITCYVGTALAVLGHILGREEWRERGLCDARVGLEALLLHGVPAAEDGEPDGFWYEGTMFYHFYSLCPLIALYDMSREAGMLSPGARSRFELMFRAPARLADDRLRLYCLGDLGTPGVMSLVRYRHLYEYAAGQIDCALYAPLLARLTRAGGARGGLAALAYGPEELPGGDGGERTTPPIGRSRSAHPDQHAEPEVNLLPAAGILRVRASLPPDPLASSTSEALDLWLRCGPYRAGHDHFDRLAIGLHACGLPISTDLGSPCYSVADIRPFYRSTFGHCTLMVDESDQQAAQDTVLEWRPGRVPHAYAAARDAYPGVTLERKLRLEPPRIFVEDRLTSAEAHRYAWLFHATGGLSVRATPDPSAPELPALPQTGAIGQLRNRTTRRTAGAVVADWRVSDTLWLRAVVSTGGCCEVTWGRTPGNPIPASRGTVVVRTECQTCRFLAVLEVHHGAPAAWQIDPADFGW